MENNKNTNNDLHQEAPLLSKLDGKNHFQLPQNYFEALPEVMTNKILNNNSLWFYFDKLSPRILIPSGALLMLVFIFLNWNTNTLDLELSEAQLSELLLEEAYTDMDAYLIYDTYAEILAEESTEELTETDQYIDYLIENNIDINTIIEEL